MEYWVLQSNEVVNETFLIYESRPKIGQKLANLWPIKLFLPKRRFLCIFCARAAFVRVAGHKNAIPSARHVALNCRERRRSKMLAFSLNF